jgi:hypothetical protein
VRDLRLSTVHTVMVHNRNNLKKGKEFSIALYYDGCGLQCRVSTLLDKQSVGLYIDGESRSTIGSIRTHRVLSQSKVTF